MASMVELTCLMECKFAQHQLATLEVTNPSSVNVVEGEPNDRPMTTGNHTVRDIYCCKCGTTLGWKYVSA
jgi:hypothetical protein